MNVKIWANLKGQASLVLSESTDYLWNRGTGSGAPASVIEKSKRRQQTMISPYISGEVEKLLFYQDQLCTNLSGNRCFMDEKLT